MIRETTKQEITGTVISDRMNKTVVVQVENLKMHPRYKKYIKRRKNYKAHDEQNECRLGDVVRLMSTRPLSKDKCWRVVEIIRRKYVSTAEIVETDELVMRKIHPAEAPKAEEPAAAPAPETVAEAEAAPETADEPAAAPAPETEEVNPAD